MPEVQRPHRDHKRGLERARKSGGILLRHPRPSLRDGLASSREALGRLLVGSAPLSWCRPLPTLSQTTAGKLRAIMLSGMPYESSERAGIRLRWA